MATEIRRKKMHRLPADNTLPRRTSIVQVSGGPLV